MKRDARILSDSWYAAYLDGNIVHVDDYFSREYNTQIVHLAEKYSVLRGILLFLACQEFDILITHFTHKGVFTLTILNALFQRRKRNIILLEFISTPPLNPFYRALWPFWRKFILGPSLRVTLARAHVLTQSEVEFYSRLYYVPAKRFVFVPWPLHFDQQRKIDIAKVRNSYEEGFGIQDYVMASGRANVDWEMIFKVAELSDWPLLVVCTAQHLERVNKLNKNGRAKVLHDISQEEHGAYVKGAIVYALCLEETYTSVGQVRLMNTIEQGVPVVATKVTGLDGYAVDGINSILITPGDVIACKNAIDRLIADPELRSKLVQNAKQFKQDQTFSNYINEIEKTVYEIS